jgi:DNA-binding XRE family transcriptional regulator
MLAVVRTPHTKLRIEGNIPRWMLLRLRQDYKSRVVITESEETVNAFETDWYKKISKTVTPGFALKTYRENIGLTQAELGKKLGDTAQHISDMENDRRAISKQTALKLAKLFHTSVERFIK